MIYKTECLEFLCAKGLFKFYYHNYHLLAYLSAKNGNNRKVWSISQYQKNPHLLSSFSPLT